MLQNFDKKEKKVIVIFLALLVLLVVYLGTHDHQFDGSDQINLNPVKEDEASSSGKYF